MRSHIDWGGDPTSVRDYKDVKISSYRFKTLRGSPKEKTQRASGGLGLLEIVSEPDFGRVTTRRLSPEGDGHEVSSRAKPKENIC